MILFQDLNPLAGGVGTVAAVIFFLIFLAVAYIAFRMMKRTVKMAARIAIAAVILAIAVAGSTVLWYYGSSSPSSSSRPTRSR